VQRGASRLSPYFPFPYFPCPRIFLSPYFPLESRPFSFAETIRLTQGWTDAMRKLHPDGPLWTFWDYKFERWQKDKGMRLDHFLLSPNLSDRLVDGSVDRWARGQENASDHAPTWIMLDL
jgi:exonuclease III